jgi:hypothetical protein
MSLQTRNYFSKALPLGLANNDRDINYSPLLDTYNVRGGIDNIIAKKEWTIKTGDSDAVFQRAQAKCESVGNGDQFDHLKSLASTEDTASRVRCGWVYNNSNPNNGRGAYGMRQGAFKTDTPGQWMWDLKKAQEKYHTAICQNIQACSDIDSDIYKKRCGWCTRSGKAVPISGQELAYPTGTNTACPPANVVTSAAQCPRPQVPTDPNYVRTPAEICSPMPNGALPRDCLLQKVTAAGCNDKGTLAQALRSGSDNDYTSVLAQERSFKVYQERAAIPMDATAIKTGKITITDALNSFSRVQDLTTSAANGGLRVAARDLCLNKGDIDEFDFCTELQDNTVGPFTLDCLQKHFRRMGGQKTGASYPNTTNLAFYNKFSKWSDFKRYVQGLSDKTKSQDRSEQEYGMSHFYGITMQNKRNPLPYGPEIAWKSGQVMVSCQRPLPIPEGYTRAGCINDEDNEMLDKWAERNGWTMGTPPPGYKKVPNVDWHGNDIHHTAGGQTVDLCQAECDKRPNCVGYNFIHQGKDCWLKSNLQNRYEHGPGVMDFYIKQPLQCKAPFANPPAEVAGWKYKGCWRDCHQGRALPNRLNNVNSIEQCIAQAKARGYNTAGNQYFGECWAGNNTDWDKMGNAGCCEPLGGGCTQQIYSSQ